MSSVTIRKYIEQVLKALCFFIYIGSIGVLLAASYELSIIINTNWIPVEAVVTNYDVHGKTIARGMGKSYVPLIRYEYTYEDNKYKASFSKFHFTSKSTKFAALDWLKKEIPHKFIAYVDSDNLEMSIPYDPDRYRSLMVYMILGSLFIFIVLSILMFKEYKSYIIMKNKLTLLLMVMFVLSSNTVMSISVRNLDIEIPVIVEQSESQEVSKSFAIDGDIFQGTYPEIEVNDVFLSSHPYYLLENILDIYQNGSVNDLLNLYSTSSRDDAEDIFDEMGSGNLLSVIRNIESFRVYGFWIKSSGLAVFYLGLNDTSYVMPYLITLEAGTWKLVAGEVDGEMASLLDLLIVKERWGDIQITDNTTTSVTLFDLFDD